ncbi:cbe703ae-d484-408b-ac94-f4d4f5c03ada-CDS [Sclerotinia trifoliorum]|uniref:Cbe703ae-d484-408b-ac94-f4d4f5c03ada-CDS n=1 Tax=Sclerotinia trifoliorum TaxID=28548 RepID=A0A8H2VUN3_9HELO|nr:cbe703ae-d484-408b-ac94-f4d4f5c03ada-CDS [Sclerotinia trifoliorum]
MYSELTLKPPELATEISSNIKCLPLELSQMIWKSTLTVNRIITIRWGHTSHRDLGRRCLAKDLHASYERVEALTVSSQSRAIAQSEYRLCFGNDMRNPIFFNSERDILKFTSLTFTQIVHYPKNNVWSNSSIRAANVKRIAIGMENDPNMALYTSTSLELNLLRWATLRFCTLEQIFIQPVFAFDSFCETVFRARFQEVMRDYQELFEPLRHLQEYRIPEIFLVCLQCDPNLSKAVRR